MRCNEENKCKYILLPVELGIKSWRYIDYCLANVSEVTEKTVTR